MKEPKRHHYVPKMLLRNFVDKSGNLHFFNKHFQKRVVKTTKPSNFCVENRLYWFDDDGSLEKKLAQLETRAAPIIMKIVKKARIGEKPGLNSSEKEIWDHFLICQWGRTPDRVTKIVNKGIKTEEEQSAIKETLGSTQFYDVIDPPKYRLEILTEKGLLVMAIRKPRESFVIGSDPVVRFQSGIPLSNPKAKLLLPVASDIAITQSSAPNCEELIEVKNPEYIRRINEKVFNQSSAIAGHSDRLIASLAKIQ